MATPNQESIETFTSITGSSESVAIQTLMGLLGSKRATDLLRIIHTNVCGPLRHVSRQSASYFITFTDDYSRYGYVYLLKHKHEVFETSKVFKNKVENQLEKTIKALRSDRGGGYISQEFKYYLKACGIVQQLTPPYTPQHNGVSERRKRTFLSYLNAWGCEALVKRDTPDKLQQRSVKCIFVRYPKETMGYYFYFPPENKIVVARYTEFLEKNLLSQEISGRAKELEEIQDEDTSPFENTSEIPMEFEGFEPPQEEVVPVCSSSCSMGFTQTFEVDYEEMFSPVADIRAIRILIAIATFYDYEIWQMNIKTAFLDGYLDEDIYMVQPEGFFDPKYPRKASGSNVTFLILYVDDIITMGNHIPSLQSVKSYLGKCFAIKDLGKAAFILGIKIYQDRSKRLIRLSQSAYMDKILKSFKMDTSNRGYIPMQEKLDLNKAQGALTPEEVKRMQNVPYASTVGSIMYAVRCTRADVAFAQNITSRFQQNPGELHWTAVKPILKYLRNTKDMFLVYGGNHEAELRVDCYCDAGFEADRDDTKSQT
ncbi:retrotransposon protein, putative, ty1-copia subclass [Tanacetum coccineum]